MQEKIAGVNSIMEALRGKRKIHKILIQEGRSGKKTEDLLRLAKKKGIFWQYVEKTRLDGMYTAANHQGIIAFVDSYEYADLDEILEKAALSTAPPFIVVLDGIEDPQNLGSIIRTAECAGVHGIIIPQHNSAEVTDAVVRTSAGGIEHMLIARETNLVNCLRKLKEKGFWIIGADMAAERDYFNCEIPSPTVLVVGGEGTGIRKLVRETCDISVKIPMRGQISSLNASVAAGLIIYEVIRQQSPKDKS